MNFGSSFGSSFGVNKASYGNVNKRKDVSDSQLAEISKKIKPDQNSLKDKLINDYLTNPYKYKFLGKLMRYDESGFSIQPQMTVTQTETKDTKKVTTYDIQIPDEFKDPLKFFEKYNYTDVVPDQLPTKVDKCFFLEKKEMNSYEIQPITVGKGDPNLSYHFMSYNNEDRDDADSIFSGLATDYICIGDKKFKSKNSLSSINSRNNNAYDFKFSLYYNGERRFQLKLYDCRVNPIGDHIVINDTMYFNINKRQDGADDCFESGVVKYHKCFRCNLEEKNDNGVMRDVCGDYSLIAFCKCDSISVTLVGSSDECELDK